MKIYYCGGANFVLTIELNNIQDSDNHLAEKNHSNLEYKL